MITLFIHIKKKANPVSIPALVEAATTTSNILS